MIIWILEVEIFNKTAFEMIKKTVNFNGKIIFNKKISELKSERKINSR